MAINFCEEKEDEEEEEEEAKRVMVSTVSFIQANLQHNIAASRISTRKESVKGIDMALVREPWYREDCIRASVFHDIPCTLRVERIDLEFVSLRGT